MSFDRPFFFNSIRSLFGGLSQAQVSGMSAVLDQWEIRMPNADQRWLGYMFATTFHETARQMVPVREAYWLSEQWRKTHLSYYPYYGRGYVQLTHQTNYKKAGDFVGANLVQSPDLALRPDYAAAAMFVGMVQGWFRGDAHGPHTLTRYFNPHTNDPIGARKIINGYEPGVAEAIAGYHSRFLSALRPAGAVPLAVTMGAMSFDGPVGDGLAMTESVMAPSVGQDIGFDTIAQTRHAGMSEAIQSPGTVSPENPAMPILSMTTDIITAYVESNSIDAALLPELIADVYAALANADRIVDRGRGMQEAEPVVAERELSAGPKKRPGKPSPKVVEASPQ
ncbi:MULTISPECIES: glycoside hydrolase family 19 protein [Mesorhizobium]|uniref:Uncharacterized protein n=1 Tax=Rhizobium loti TaxID=381 RepID=A0A6M7U4F4_RHILI|nr:MULTISPECIES: glycoside hydrolase family 19 protein [Mesorhizobium]KRB31734.1 hypothetical protein ASE05_01390 [Mesorhizobium sp. Root172]OBQ72230.1 hypothetical protein A8145_05255 [Mesorhizobium loti]QKC72174.1 hypothetical protein EB815_25730 [Mesorhizobium loti]